MKGNSDTIAALNTTAGLLAHLIAQYAVDHAELRRLGDKWLACKIKQYAKKLYKQHCEVLKRIENLDGTPSYDLGKVAGQTDQIDPEVILKRDLDLLQAADDAICAFRSNAMDDRADYSPDVLEHVIEVIEHQLSHFERELNLINVLTVPGYIGARLEDGEPKTSKDN